VVVLVEQGGHGGSVAEPAARQILSKLFSVKYQVVYAVDNSR
jgi:cell division protein FtsI/penicillin-binding protein 2